jgi:uncharacterized protein (DUF1800 family)
MTHPARILAKALACAAALLVAAIANAQGATPAEAAHVLDRLAFGPAPGDVARVARIGIDRYIDEQLHPERIALPAALVARLDALPSLHRASRELIDDFREASRAARDGGEPARAERRERVQRIAFEAAEDRLLRAVASPRQLEEVMVEFWFNHFNVFAGKGLDRVLVGAYERDAIRPHVLGRFRDLLGATARHPAMLFYLDNWLSAGGALNENYARELMELHTLGVDGGYTQRDVTELARVFTGWTIAARGADDSGFAFVARRHDDGAKQWLGRPVVARGRAEGEWALDVLAAHPATAHHIAYELAQYFVADAPPPALVERLAQRYVASDGDIRAVLATLFASREFRDPAARGAKYKTPWRFVVSALRASAVPATDARPLLATLRRLGMPLHGCATPDGYKDTESAWLNPDALSRRIGFATALAAGRGLDAPPAAADALLATLDGRLSAQTRAAVEKAEPGLSAALVLGSPDFMRH